GDDWRVARMERRNRVDLFNVFSGALAVHESLQMDTMLGDRRPKTSPFEKEKSPPKETEKEPAKKILDEKPAPETAPKSDERKPDEKKKEDAPKDPKRAGKVRGFLKRLADKTPSAANMVRIDSLTGPTIKSHPWGTMLGGRKPEVSALSKMV